MAAGDDKTTKSLRRKKRPVEIDCKQSYEKIKGKDKEWLSAVMSPLGLGLILGMVLLDAFPERAKEIKELMEDDNIPLSQKAKIAYILGIIDKDLKDDLVLMYKIRNKFAHSFEGKFTHEKVRKLVESLSTIKDKSVTEENSYALYESAVKECAYKIGDILDKLKEGNS